ncbi:DUF6156 family protein [Uliginosibacterium paludis]|uniref:DUF6156 family protein n=1 Tax=Uliginosibacterium paludis TaxID=1615952 RepID=A0ABV2CLM5_9RHOO
MSTRYFLSYSGVSLPLRLVEEIPEAALRNRNTWFRADYDEAGRLCRIEKCVYGETEMTHEYLYDTAGRMVEARVMTGDEDETQILRLDLPA